jgi:hypothetical protein
MRMFWRGVLDASPDREALVKVTEGHRDVANVEQIEWGSVKPENYVSPAEMCSWKYIIYTEGSARVF